MSPTIKDIRLETIVTTPKAVAVNELVDNGVDYATEKLRKDLSSMEFAIAAALKINNPRLAITHFADIAFACLEETRNMFGMKYPNSVLKVREAAIGRIYDRLLGALIGEINKCNTKLIKEYPSRADNEYMTPRGLVREISKRKQDSDNEFKNLLTNLDILRGERKYGTTAARFDISQHELVATINLLTKAMGEKNEAVIEELKKLVMTLLQEIDISGQLDLLEATIYKVHVFRKAIEADGDRLGLLKTKLAALYIKMCELAAKYKILGAIGNASNFTPDAAINKSMSFSLLIDKILLEVNVVANSNEPNLTRFLSVLKESKTLAEEDIVATALTVNDFASTVEQLKVYQSQLYKSLWGNPTYEDYVYAKTLPVTRDKAGQVYILGQKSEDFSNPDLKVSSEYILAQVSLNKRNNNRGISETKKRMHEDGKMLDIYYSNQRTNLNAASLNKAMAWPEDFKKMLLAMYRIDIMINSIRNVSRTTVYKRVYGAYIAVRTEKKQAAALSRSRLVTEAAELMSSSPLK